MREAQEGLDREPRSPGGWIDLKNSVLVAQLMEGKRDVYAVATHPFLNAHTRRASSQHYLLT